jgi:hypothetical protein
VKAERFAFACIGFGLSTLFRSAFALAFGAGIGLIVSQRVERPAL